MDKIIVFIMVFMLQSATGLQTKQVHANQRVVADVSLESINRIYVLDDRIAQVFSLNEELAIETDVTTGQVFLRTKQNKPIDLTIITEKQLTVDLHLIPKNLPGETILIKSNQLTTSNKINAKVTNYLEQITRLMLAMASNKPIIGYSVHQVNKEILLWEKITLIQTNAYIGNKLTGEIYSLTNKTKERIFLTETQFGWQKGIAAVTIKKHALAPKEQTQIYVIRHAT
jgi:type-F conjugative transfer system secretin TraK